MIDSCGTVHSKLLASPCHCMYLTAGATGRLKRQMETMTPTILIEDLPSGLKFQHIMNPDKPQNDLVYTIATPPHQLEVCLDGLKNTVP